MKNKARSIRLREVVGEKRLEGIVRITSYGSIGGLGLLLLALLLPYIPSSSQAESCLDNPTIEGCYKTTAETEVGVTASTAISLALDQAVQMEVIPTSTGATSSASTKLSVSTNNNEGYALYMQAGSSTGNLTNTASMIGSEIKNTTKQDVVLSELEKNAYGYALTTDEVGPSTTYSMVPTVGSVIKRTTTVTPSEGNYAYGDTYHLAFGVNVGTDIVAGTYTGIVTLSAIANPRTLTTMFDLSYMQDMTPDICTNTREGYTKQLIDTRDGKSYWVAKLKDGNCWMTQNLALDITEAGLKAADSDLTHDWNAQYTGNGLVIGVDVIPDGAQSKDEYVPTATQNEIINHGMSNRATYSWNFGKWVLGAPTLMRSCGDQKTTILGCTKVGFVDVSGAEWRPTFTARVLNNGETVTLDDGNLSITSTADNPQTIAVDPVAKTYDPHYLIGNYYQFNAVTAGAGGAVGDGVIEVSICPKGWKLPMGGDKYQDPSNNFYSLLEKYGLDRNITGSSDGKSYNVANYPLYLVRGGLINISNSSLRYAGLGGSLWSRTASSKFSDGSVVPSAFYLNFNNVEVSNYKLEYRWVGYPARCLARQISNRAITGGGSNYAYESRCQKCGFRVRRN